MEIEIIHYNYLVILNKYFLLDDKFFLTLLVSNFVLETYETIGVFQTTQPKTMYGTNDLNWKLLFSVNYLIYFVTYDC